MRPAAPECFWRGWCLALALVAAGEAACIAFMPRAVPAPTPIAPPPAATTLPAAPEPLPAVTEPEETIPRAPRARVRDARFRARELEDLGVSLTKKDFPAAARAFKELTSDADRCAMIRGIFEVLAQGDPAQALACAREVGVGRDRETALTTLLDRWRGPVYVSPEQRAQHIARFGLDAGLGMELLEGESPRPDLALLWANDLPAGNGRVTMLGDAAALQLASNPALAATYGDGLEGKDRLVFNDRLVKAWAVTQPDAAWQWSSALDDPAARARAQNSVVAAESSTDPQGASARLALLPNDDQRFETLKTVAANYSQKNTDAALAWAQTLSPDDSAQARVAIDDVSPVGVGIRLSNDAEGYPIVGALIANLGAEQSGSIHRGDRIVAVSQGDGQFVDVHQLDLQQVTRLVRGEAGSLVQLQVAPALPGGGYGAPIVVPVIRQRIKSGG